MVAFIAKDLQPFSVVEDEGFRYLETDGLGPQIGCFAHTVNLAAKKAVSIDGVSRLLGKV